MRAPPRSQAVLQLLGYKITTEGMKEKLPKQDLDRLKPLHTVLKDLGTCVLGRFGTVPVPRAGQDGFRARAGWDGVRAPRGRVRALRGTGR